MGYKLECISVYAGDGYVNSHVFGSIADVKRHVRTQLGEITAYWRVYVLDDNGNRVVMGTRAGRNGTGKRWIWEDMPKG